MVVSGRMVLSAACEGFAASAGDRVTIGSEELAARLERAGAFVRSSPAAAGVAAVVPAGRAPGPAPRGEVETAKRGIGEGSREVAGGQRKGKGPGGR